MATGRLQSGPLSLTNARLETEELFMGDDSGHTHDYYLRAGPCRVI
jgi:hypothetical protein